MRDLKKHNQNLVSFIFDNGIRDVFFDLLKNINSEYNFFLFLKRLNYDTEVPSDLKILYQDSPLFELFSELKGDMINKLDLILWGWNSFDNFNLMITKKTEIKDTKEALQRSAERNAFIYESFVIYRGIEENVIWVNKSSLLNFDNLIRDW